jgi:hypothetical protein
MWLSSHYSTHRVKPRKLFWASAIDALSTLSIPLAFIFPSKKTQLFSSAVPQIFCCSVLSEHSIMLGSQLEQTENSREFMTFGEQSLIKCQVGSGRWMNTSPHPQMELPYNVLHILRGSWSNWASMVHRGTLPINTHMSFLSSLSHFLTHFPWLPGITTLPRRTVFFVSWCRSLLLYFNDVLFLETVINHFNSFLSPSLLFICELHDSLSTFSLV